MWVGVGVANIAHWDRFQLTVGPKYRRESCKLQPTQVELVCLGVLVHCRGAREKSELFEAYGKSTPEQKSAYEWVLVAWLIHPSSCPVLERPEAVHISPVVKATDVVTPIPEENL